MRGCQNVQNYLMKNARKGFEDPSSCSCKMPQASFSPTQGEGGEWQRDCEHHTSGEKLMSQDLNENLLSPEREESAVTATTDLSTPLYESAIVTSIWNIYWPSSLAHPFHYFWFGFGYTADTDMKDDSQVRILDTPILNAWQTFGVEEVRPMDVGLGPLNNL